MFRVYKPKNFIKVRALQVTVANISEVAGLLLGRVSQWKTDVDEAPTTQGVEVPTFDGPLRFEVGSWIIRAEDNSLSKMSNEEFKKTYEVARNMGGNAGVQVGNGNNQTNTF